MGMEYGRSYFWSFWKKLNHWSGGSYGMRGAGINVDYFFYSGSMSGSRSI